MDTAILLLKRKFISKWRRASHVKGRSIEGNSKIPLRQIFDSQWLLNNAVPALLPRLKQANGSLETFRAPQEMAKVGSPVQIPICSAGEIHVIPSTDKQ